MGRFHGAVGYAESVELMTDDGRPTGEWVDRIKERMYTGDYYKRGSKWSNGIGSNDDLTITTDISIIADPYAYNNFSKIKYVCYGGANWKVTAVDVQRPRIILTTGGVWNGESN